MFNYFVGEIKKYGNKKLLVNDFFGVEINYDGDKINGEFFIFPYYDDNINTYLYIGFDNIEQKIFFEKIYKLPGIGIKVAYKISILNIDKIKNAIEEFDISFFKSIPGVGPKTAKRLLVELKSNFSEKDINKLNIDEKLFKDIIGSLKGLGYEISSVRNLLEKSPIELERKNISSIIKWLIDNLK